MILTLMENEMNEDDLLQLLDDNEKTNIEISTPQQSDNTYKKQKRESYWDKQDIKSLKIEPSMFKKNGKSFMVYGIYDKTDVLPDTIIEKFVAISRGLVKKDYTFRHYGSDKNSLQNKILEIEGIRTQSFLPFSRFNQNIQHPVCKFPTDKAYSIMVGLHNNFYRCVPALRAILSSFVNAMLGKDCDDPVDVVILYNPSGLEVLSKDTDYTNSGNIPILIKMCKAANIPYFNIGKEENISKLVEFIKNKD